MAKRSSGPQASGTAASGTAVSAEERSRQSSVGKRPMPDSFDNPPKLRRVGAHRAPKKPGGAWIRVMWIALATIALTAAGIILVVIGPQNLLFPGATDPSQQAQIEKEAEIVGVTDPSTTVTVLNGTRTPGLADEVADIISNGPFGTVEFVGNSDDQSVTISAIFFSDPADEALAKGLGEKLGGMFYYLREDYVTFGTKLVVLIGADYQSVNPVPPGETDPENGSGANG